MHTDQELTRKEGELIQAVKDLADNVFTAEYIERDETKRIRQARLTRHLVNEVLSIEENRGSVRVEGINETVIIEPIAHAPGTI